MIFILLQIYYKIRQVIMQQFHYKMCIVHITACIKDAFKRFYVMF